MKLVWTAKARHQLMEVIAYIAKDAPERAVAYGQKIEGQARKLARFHQLGRAVPELSEEFPALREILIGEYRLVYRLRPHHIEILTLFHGRRRFPY